MARSHIFKLATFLIIGQEKECSTGTDRDDNSAGAKGYNQRVSPLDDAPDGTNGGSVSQEALWNKWCFIYSTYRDGYMVRFNYEPVSDYDRELERVIQARNLPDGDLIYLTAHCTYRQGVSSPTTIIVPASEAPLVVGAAVVRDRAAARITIADPVVESNPSFNEPGRFGVAGIPTWFWLNDPWDPITVSDSEGSVSVTVTATPTVVSWDPGDGSVPVVCFDAGVPWISGLPEDASNCKHTYRSSSADQPDMQYNLSATTSWVFTWSVNGVDQGEFTTVQASTEFTYQVGEIQAVEVR